MGETSLKEKGRQKKWGSDRRKCPVQKVQNLCLPLQKKKGKRKKKEKRQGGLTQIKTTFDNLLKEAYLHLYEDWVGREKKIRLLLPLNCQVSLESSHSCMSRVNSFPLSLTRSPGAPPDKSSRRSTTTWEPDFPGQSSWLLTASPIWHQNAIHGLSRGKTLRCRLCWGFKCLSGLPGWHCSFLDSALIPSTKNT